MIAGGGLTSSFNIIVRIGLYFFSAELANLQYLQDPSKSSDFAIRSLRPKPRSELFFA